MIIKKSDAESFEQPGVVGRKYKIEEFLSNRSWVYGELDGEHGECVSTEVPRLYYVISGKGRVKIDSKSTEIGEGDLVIIPPKTKYNYWSDGGILKFILFMENH